MKKRIGFTALVLILAAIFVCPTAYAKPYKALTKEVGSPVEIPDETVLPDYMARLEYAETDWLYGTPLFSVGYSDPEFHYFNDEGTEIFPYSEVVKQENNQFYLVGIFFVNDKNVIEFYFDKEALEKSVTGKFEKYVPEKEDRVQKVPREMREK